MNSIQQNYESIAYPHYIHPLSDPARLAAVGRILGLPAADPARARVLDIGCGAATNLLAMAARFPGARFTGIDFSGPDIASALALAAEAGLTNVSLSQADLLDWDPGDATFDFIIAYGFFSWVPDPVKDAMLATIRRCLAPQGIALVTYMTYPGCKQPEALRDLLRLRTQSAASAAERVAMAHATLDHLDRAWAAAPNAPHVVHARTEARHMRAKEAHFLLLDDLGVERDPFYLTQFAARAGEHGLRYLGEADFPSMLLESLPVESARALAGMQLGALETEQMMDFVTNRAFRASLLVAAEAAPADDGLHPDALRELSLSTSLRIDDGAPPVPGEARFAGGDGQSFGVRSPPLVAALCTLIAHPGSRMPFAELLAAVESALGGPLVAADASRLRHDLLALCCHRRVDLALQPFHPPATWPARPRLTPFNAALLRTRGLLATATQESARLSEPQRALCDLLDGTHDGPALRASGPGRVLGDDLERCLEWLARLGCLAEEAV